MAQIGWIDFSPEHRERVAAVLDLLRPEGVVDELGVGGIRDAFADSMFPGISTIQTRAKYFFITPYILYEYQLLSPARQRNKTPEKYLEEQEYEIMWKLADKYDHRDGSGVIGISKYKPDKIMRRPSAIYWNGLSVLGLVQHGGLGVNTFLRSRMGSMETLVADLVQGDDSPADDADVDYANRFNLKLPYDKNWRDMLTLDLTREEADIICHRIREAGRGILIGELMENRELFKKFKEIDSFADFSKLCSAAGKVDNDIRKMLVLSHDFSELMYGAHVAYNCLLQQKKFGTDAFFNDWDEWLSNIHKSMIDFSGFNPDNVFEYALRVRAHTRKFVYDWWNFISASSHPLKRRDELIEEQEFNTKKYKARIKHRKLDDVKEGKWIGLSRLEYRMPQAKRILQDVINGLRSE